MDARLNPIRRNIRGRKGKGPYVGVRFRGTKWISEIRIPGTSTRIWLGSHDSAEKAARAYDAATYCLKREQGYFNFPNNRRPDLVNKPVGSLSVEEIQRIAEAFSHFDEQEGNVEHEGIDEHEEIVEHEGIEEHEETLESSWISLVSDIQMILESPNPQQIQDKNEADATKALEELHVQEKKLEKETYITTSVAEEDPYIPTFMPNEEQNFQIYAPEEGHVSKVLAELDEWFGPDGDWKQDFPWLHSLLK